MTRVLTLALVAIASIGAATARAQSGAAPGLSCAVAARPMAKVEILFGLSRQQGRIVSESQWRAFVDREVTPRFPDGLTILAGHGQWRGANGRATRESMRMLVIWYAPDDQASARIDAIREAYRKRFGQASVMRVDEWSCVTF